jgi:hypothetical protein
MCFELERGFVGGADRTGGGRSMQLTGFLMIHIDVDPDVAYDYNRWYDLDHGPEAVSLPGVVGTRRYHASRDLIDARVASEMTELAEGPGEFLTVYWLGDENLDATLDRILSHLGPDSPIAREGRLFRRDKVRLRNAEVFRRTEIHPGDAIDAAEEAVPYLGHRGIYLEVWQGDDTLGDWLRQDHAPFLTNHPAILGTIALSGMERGHPDWHVLVSFLGQDPADVAPALRERFARVDAQDADRRIFGGCFRLIDPLRYDFAKPS